ncbi:Uncharacterised protein [Sphingomonas paucimobilis]|nr:Uncharacterised protein [Sphingomonas paucimobilis]
MLADDDQPGFGQQEMDVGDAAMQRIFDRDDRAVGLARLHSLQRVGEIEAGQRQTIGKGLDGGDMAVGARRPLERDGARGWASAAWVIASTIGRAGAA